LQSYGDSDVDNKYGSIMKKIKHIILCLATLIAGFLILENPVFAERDGELLDVNATSPTFNQYILPEDYEDLVSAWYFGHST
jgi:hypothetical protein